jgi:putative addiction module component (TIGR02574 family)
MAVGQRGNNAYNQPMQQSLEELVDAALRLPSEERAVLAQRLRESLADFKDADVEQAWLEEADRRWEEIESGQVTCESAEVVLARARESLTSCG